MKITNAVGVTKVLPPSIFWKEVPLSIDVPITKHHDGGVRSGKRRVNTRRFEIRGELLSTVTNLDSELDDLYSFLTRSPLKCYQRNDSTRYMKAELISAPRTYINPNDAAEIVITVEALEPYYLADTQASRPSDSAANFTIDVAGSAPAWPIVTLSGGSNPRLINLTNNSDLQYLGGNSGNSVILDAYVRTATRAGINVLDSMNRDTIPNFFNGFYLDPGLNEFSLQGGGAVTMTWYPRWW